MLNTTFIKNIWKDLESKHPAPKYVTKINIIEFKDLKNKIDDKKQKFVKNIIKKMYKGEAFIVRNAAQKKLRDTVIGLAKFYDKKKKTFFS